MKMTPEQEKAAELYAKATPRQAMRRALRKYRVPLSSVLPSQDGINDDHEQKGRNAKRRDKAEDF